MNDSPQCKFYALLPHLTSFIIQVTPPSALKSDLAIQQQQRLLREVLSLQQYKKGKQSTDINHTQERAIKRRNPMINSVLARVMGEVICKNVKS